MKTEQIQLSDLVDITRKELEEFSREILEEQIIPQLEAIKERTSDQEMLLLNAKIILIQKDLHSPTTAAVLASKSPKKSIIVLWADYLEKLYEIESEKNIPTTVKSIGHISSYIKTELRTMGVETQMSWVHESLPHKYKLGDMDDAEKQNNQDDVQRRQDSSLNIDPKEENKILIELIEKEIKVKQSIKNKLISSHFMALLSEEEQAQTKELYLKAYNIIDITGDLFDDRVSCPTMLQHLLLNAHIQATDNFAAGVYVNKVKDFGANRWDLAKQLIKKQYDVIAEVTPEIKKLKKILDKLDPKSTEYKEAKQKLSAEEFKERNARLAIKAQKEKDTMTSKQTMKVLQRRMKNLLPILEPSNRDDAISIGFYGVQCEKCGSYRTFRDIGKSEGNLGKMVTICIACEHEFETKFASKCLNQHCSFPFYDDVVKVMLKKAKEENGALNCHCPRCNEEVILSKKYLPKVIQ